MLQRRALAAARLITQRLLYTVKDLLLTLLVADFESCLDDVVGVLVRQQVLSIDAATLVIHVALSPVLLNLLLSKLSAQRQVDDLIKNLIQLVRILAMLCADPVQHLESVLHELTAILLDGQVSTLSLH